MALHPAWVSDKNGRIGRGLWLKQFLPCQKAQILQSAALAGRLIRASLRKAEPERSRLKL